MSTFRDHIKECNDKEFKDMCDDSNPILRNSARQACPKTCGQCSTNVIGENNCVDLNGADCEKNLLLCENVYYSRLMSSDCRKTCGYCLPPNTPCQDKNTADCQRWNINGFCSNTDYPKGMKLMQCPLTSVCAENFPPNKKDANTTRPTLCESPELFDEALQCAKTCKFCCKVKVKPDSASSSLISGRKSEAGNLKTNSVFILECKFVKDRCKEDPWISVLKSRCEASCGECSPSSPNTCSDKHIRCADVSATRELCDDSQYGPLLQLRCAKSCEKCASAVIATTTPSSIICEDKSSDCQRNFNQCTNILYQSLMRDQCPKTSAQRGIIMVFALETSTLEHQKRAVSKNM
uniref:ShKT domain-containing protein n=1 Tax=Ditylenchus dipsaci TaxID=166011 RepID=A0A915E2G0_9BILA